MTTGDEFTWPVAAVLIATIVVAAAFVLGMNYLAVLASKEPTGHPRASASTDGEKRP